MALGIDLSSCKPDHQSSHYVNALEYIVQSHPEATGILMSYTSAHLQKMMTRVIPVLMLNSPLGIFMELLGQTHT